MTKVLRKLDYKNIFILRHAETDFNKRGVVQGSGIDAPLNDTGKAQARAFYTRYKNYPFDKIYISGRFHKEIKKIGKKHFKNKEIIHVAARTSRPLTDGYYKKLNVKYVQTFCHFWDQFSTSYGKSHIDKYPSLIELKLIPDCMRERGYPPLNYRVLERFCEKFDNYKEMCSFLNKNIPIRILKRDYNKSELTGKKEWVEKSRVFESFSIFDNR